MTAWRKRDRATRRFSKAGVAGVLLALFSTPQPVEASFAESDDQPVGNAESDSVVGDITGSDEWFDAADPPEGFGQPAPLLDDVRLEYGIAEFEVEELEAAIAADLNAAEGGTTSTGNLVEPADLLTYVVPSDDANETHYVTVPEGTLVNVDGEVWQPLEGVPAADSSNLRSLTQPSILPAQDDPGAPFLSGPWRPSSYYSWDHVRTIEDDPGRSEIGCTGDTVARVLGKTYSSVLDEDVPTTDFLGISKWTTWEFIETSSNRFASSCNSYMDALETYFFLDTEGIICEDEAFKCDYLSKSPISFPGTDCSTTEVSAEAELVDGLSASIGQTFERCDSWESFGGTETRATQPFGLRYDNNGRCSDSPMEAYLAVIVTFDDGGADIWDPGNGGAQVSGISLDPDQDDNGHNPHGVIC